MAWRPWTPAAAVRQQTSRVPQALLHQASARAMVGPAMQAPLAAGQQLSEAEATAQCASVMSEVATVQQHAHESSTVKTRHRHCKQVQEWCSQLPASWGVNLATAGPEHLLWYCQEEFTKKNTGTVLPDGSKVAAPSSVQAMFSHLSTGLKALGRVGEWDPETRSGNPVNSPAVKQYKEGYNRMLRAQGFEEGSAVAWVETDVFAVIDQLDREAAAARHEAAGLEADGRPLAAFSPLLQSLLLDRDATCITYLWWGLQRGKECGALALPDFADEHGNEVLSRLSGLLAKEPEKAEVFVYPNGIKQQPHQRVDEPVPFSVDGQVPLQYQFIPRLEQHLRLCADAAREYPFKSGLAVTHYVLRPSNKGQSGLLDRPWSSTGIYSRVVEAAQRAGVYKGQSVHSFRRGGMQHREEQGESREAIQERAHIKTPAVASRYLNRRRQNVKLQKMATKVKHHDRLGEAVSQRWLTVLQQHGLVQAASSPPS